MAAERGSRVFAERRPRAGNDDIVRELDVSVRRCGVAAVYLVGKGAQLSRRANEDGRFLRAVAGRLGGLVGPRDRDGLCGLVLADGEAGLGNIVIVGVRAERDRIAVIARLGERVGIVVALICGERRLAVLQGQVAALRAGEGEGAGERRHGRGNRLGRRCGRPHRDGGASRILFKSG